MIGDLGNWDLWVEDRGLYYQIYQNLCELMVRWLGMNNYPIDWGLFDNPIEGWISINQWNTIWFQQTWLESPYKWFLARKIIEFFWSIFQQASFDYRRVII